MTLTTHAVVGAAVASLMPTHPVLGMCAAFVSHFAIDAIPHWDYPIASASINPQQGGGLSYDKDLLVDVVRIGADLVFGLLLAVALFATPQLFWIVLAGACAGIVPDPLQFAYLRIRREPLVSLQRFHEWIHTKNHLLGAKTFGIFSQLLLVALVVAATRLVA